MRSGWRPTLLTPIKQATANSWNCFVEHRTPAGVVPRRASAYSAAVSASTSTRAAGDVCQRVGVFERACPHEAAVNGKRIDGIGHDTVRSPGNTDVS